MCIYINVYCVLQLLVKRMSGRGFFLCLVQRRVRVDGYVIVTLFSFSTQTSQGKHNQYSSVIGCG